MRARKTVMRAAGRLRRAWDSHLRQITLAEGIPDSYRTVLLFLRRHPGSGQRNIAEFANVTTSAINQAVKSMVEEGYLRKETDSNDKRSSKLYLTEKGVECAERLRGKLDTSDAAITAMLGEVREAELIGILEQLAEFIGKDLG